MVDQPERVREPPSDTDPPPVIPPRVFKVMDEFWSCAFPMVDVATTCPEAFTERSDEERPVSARLVVVALVVVLLMTEREPIVEEDDTSMPSVVVGRSEPATILQSRNCEV